MLLALQENPLPPVDTPVPPDVLLAPAAPVAADALPPMGFAEPTAAAPRTAPEATMAAAAEEESSTMSRGDSGRVGIIAGWATAGVVLPLTILLPHASLDSADTAAHSRPRPPSPPRTSRCHLPAHAPLT